MAIRVAFVVLAMTFVIPVYGQGPTPETSVEVMGTALMALTQRSVFPALSWPLESALVFPGERQLMQSGEVLHQTALLSPDGLTNAFAPLLTEDTSSIRFGPGASALTITGTVAEYSKIDQAVRALERALSRRVEFRLQFVSSSHKAAQDLPDLLDAEQVHLLHPHLKGSVSLGAEGLVGQVISLQSVRKQDFVFDADVEVGGGVSGPNPMTSTLRIGHQWWVRARSAGEGLWYVDLQGRHSAVPRDVKSPIRNIDTGTNVRVDLAKLQSNVFAASAVLKDGGGIVLRAFGDDGLLGLLTIHEKGKRATGAATPSIPWSWIVPPTYHAAAVETKAVPTPSGRTTHSFGYHSDGEVLERLDENFARAALPKSLVPKLAGIVADHVLFASNVRVRAPKSAPTPTYSIEVLGSSIPHNLAAKTGHFEAAEIAQFKHHLKTTARSGSGFYLGTGLEQTYVRDYDVEINQTTLHADPVVSLFLSGIAVSGTLQTQGHEANLQCRVFLQRESAAPKSTPPLAGNGIKLDIKRAITMRGKQSLTLPLNAWTAIGLGAGANESETSAVFVRLALISP